MVIENIRLECLYADRSAVESASRPWNVSEFDIEDTIIRLLDGNEVELCYFSLSACKNCWTPSGLSTERNGPTGDLGQKPTSMKVSWWIKP